MNSYDYDYNYEPKPRHWRRFGVVAVLPIQYAQPALDWLWERYSPTMNTAMVVTHGSVRPTDQETVAELALVMEYAARGANKTDIRRKVSQAITKVANSWNVLHRVEARQMAFVDLEFHRWTGESLEDRVFAARELADEISARQSWPEPEPDDDQDPRQSSAVQLPANEG